MFFLGVQVVTGEAHSACHQGPCLLRRRMHVLIVLVGPRASTVETIILYCLERDATQLRCTDYTDKATAPADDIEPNADTTHGIYPQIFTAAPGSWHYFCIDVSYRHQEDLPGIQVGFSPTPLARSRSTACVLSRDLGLRAGGGEANEFDGQEERAPNVSEGWQQAQCHQACR